MSVQIRLLLEYIGFRHRGKCDQDYICIVIHLGHSCYRGFGSMMSRSQLSLDERNRRLALVKEGLERGETYKQIIDRTGLPKSSISGYAHILGYGHSELGPKPRYDWSDVQAYHDLGNGPTACQRKFGFYKRSWEKAVDRGDIVPRSMIRSIETLSHRGGVKKRLYQLGRGTMCEECGVSSWMGKPLSLHLHHINGINKDNEVKNLQFLCPNCHSQTSNYAGRSTRHIGRSSNGSDDRL